MRRLAQGDARRGRLGQLDGQMGLQGKDVLDVFATECRYRVAAMRDRVHHALARSVSSASRTGVTLTPS